jgi:Sulfotransferase domain
MKLQTLLVTLIGAILILATSCEAAEKKTPKWAPDFLIIGAMKAGTTVLQHFIMEHPQVAYKRGEIHFFDAVYHRGLNWYKCHLPRRLTSRHLVCDKSPYYMAHPLVPRRVHALNPDMKIIVILRNPIDRAYSHYQHNKRQEREPLTFEEAIEKEPERLAGEVEKMKRHHTYKSSAHRRYSYLARSRYAELLKRWFAYFPKEQFFIISSNDLREKPAKIMDSVFEFLELPAFRQEDKYRNNRHKYEPMDPATRQKLAEYFEPHNRELEELLGRKFNWK